MILMLSLASLGPQVGRKPTSAMTDKPLIIFDKTYFLHAT